MKTYFSTINSLLAFVCIVISISSCKNDDTDFDYIINAVPEYEIKTIAFDETPLVEDDSIPSFDKDYYENSRFTRAVNIIYNGNTANVECNYSGIDFTIDGAHVVVNSTIKGIHYIISGNTSNGSLKIYSEKKFLMSLNGVDIFNPKGAAINNQCKKSMFVDIVEGTTNYLKDGSQYETPTNEDEKGTLFSEGQIIFSGKGVLNVEGNYRNGITSDDYIIFRPGIAINVHCYKRNCIKANDGIFIRGGALNLLSNGKGNKAINSEANIEISGGRTVAIVDGEMLFNGNDTTKVTALKCDSNFVLSGGTVSLINQAHGGKGIRSHRNVNIKGGKLTIETKGKHISSSPKGIKADGEVSFDGGEAYIYSAHSIPVEARNGMSIGPTMTIAYSSDNRLLQIK